MIIQLIGEFYQTLIFVGIYYLWLLPALWVFKWLFFVFIPYLKK